MLNYFAFSSCVPDKKALERMLIFFFNAYMKKKKRIQCSIAMGEGEEVGGLEGICIKAASFVP